MFHLRLYSLKVYHLNLKFFIILQFYPLLPYITKMTMVIKLRPTHILVNERELTRFVIVNQNNIILIFKLKQYYFKKIIMKSWFEF